MIARAGKFSGRWIFPALAALVLACAAGFAGRGAATDSVTVDEPSHLIAGYAALALGDFRLSPDHPPLGRLLLALPLLAQPVVWRAEGSAAWQGGDFFTLGRDFFESWNDGQHLVLASRAVAIGFLLALLLTIGAVARALFGPVGGLLAMGVAAFDPALLAHGHLATLDVPFALCALLTLFAAHRWLAEPSGRRLAHLAAAFSASTLIKFSWFALVPALMVLALAARRGAGWKAVAKTIAVATATLALTALVSIWAVYGFRFAAARGGDSAASPANATMHVIGDFGRPLPTTPESAWESILHDPATGADRPDLTVPLLRAAHSIHLLPEAYLYGIAYVQKKAVGRASYLRGSYSTTGFPGYFLWAFAVKTPLPTMLLIAGALAVGAARTLRAKRISPLAIGLLTFVLVYLAALSTSGLNLGYRHLLPATAILTLAIGGLAPARFPKKVRSPLALGIGAALAWLAIGTWIASPLLLGYFNEAVGGWRNGHKYLADSNLDWGQDLLRLRDRLHGAPGDRPVWLAQAGDPPLPAGTPVRWLLGVGSHEPSTGSIAGGVYVISATDLLGVYRPLARVASWRDPRLAQQYEALAAESDAGGSTTTSEPVDSFEVLRRLRLISRLAQREPEERIGTSLFVYHLSDDQVAEATEP
ncbi:MAG: glycosyltransferase family 39 protein [Acidobacteriota bacterium]